MDTANTIAPESLESDRVRIDSTKLQQALDDLEGREFVPLDLRL